MCRGGHFKPLQALTRFVPKRLWHASLCKDTTPTTFLERTRHRVDYTFPPISQIAKSCQPGMITGGAEKFAQSPQKTPPVHQ